MMCRTDHIPRSAAPSDLLRGHRVQIMHAPCTYTQLNTMCCWEGPPPGANSLQCFFFWIKEKLWLLKLNLEVKNEPKNGNLDLSIYKGQNGKFWLRNLDLPICVTDCHTVRGGGKAVTGGYASVVIKIPTLVPPVLLCWWRMMMMMMMVQWGLTIVAHLTAGGWWRTYSGLTPPCGWISDENLQWFHALFTSWWGGGVITSYISLMGHSVRQLSLPFGGSTSATQVHFTQQ